MGGSILLDYPGFPDNLFRIYNPQMLPHLYKESKKCNEFIHRRFKISSDINGQICVLSQIAKLIVHLNECIKGQSVIIDMMWYYRKYAWKDHLINDSSCTKSESHKNKKLEKY